MRPAARIARAVSSAWRYKLLEWRALNCLIDRNPGQARALIDDTLAALNSPDTTDPGAKENKRYVAFRLASDALTPAAMVYDWCYEQLTSKDKAEFYSAIIRLAKKTEHGYPPVPESTITGHSSENMLMRDLISASIALYDEHPDVYRCGASSFSRNTSRPGIGSTPTGPFISQPPIIPPGSIPKSRPPSFSTGWVSARCLTRANKWFPTSGFT